MIIGDGGNDDYDSEGGDDIMVSGPGIERNEGMLGFDWVTHRGDPQAANADMDFTGLLPPDLDNVRDRFDPSRACRAGTRTTSCGETTPTPAEQIGNELKNAEQIADRRAPGPARRTPRVHRRQHHPRRRRQRHHRGPRRQRPDRRRRVARRAARRPRRDNGGTKRVDSMKDVQADVLSGKIDPGQVDIVREIKTAAPGTTSTRPSSPGRAPTTTSSPLSTDPR